ncbi:MAG: hypothetical protein SGJ18_04700 [Pseudomonadota bacterium]|nr:hypothetical protein [Pseudomonadota bacterium]
MSLYLKGFFSLSLVIVLQLPAGTSAGASEVSVFEVQKNIPLTSEDIVYKDYYVTGGSQQGLQKGMVITVVRNLPVHDTLKNKSQGLLTNPVARIQIIHVENEFSVGRLYSSIDRVGLPILEFEGIMVGDFLDMGSALVPGKKAKREEPQEDPKVDQKIELKAELREEAKPSGLPVATTVGKPSL